MDGVRDTAVADAEPITERLPKLRREHDRISAENLAFEARAYMPNGTLSTSTVQKVETGERRAQVPLLEAVAKVLGVAPDSFPEYRLAQARRLLDEREVGLSQALRNFEAVESVLLMAGADGAEPASARNSDTQASASPTLAGMAQAARRRGLSPRGVPGETKSPRGAPAPRRKRSA